MSGSFELAFFLFPNRQRALQRIKTLNDSGGFPKHLEFS